MKNVGRFLLATALVLLAGMAHAQTINWKYVEAGYGGVDPDRGSSESGWFVGGAFDLGKAPIHFIADFGNFGDLDIWQVGGGWHGLFGEKADLFADGTFYDADVEDGFKIRFGVRWMVAKRIEVNGNLFWTDLDLSDAKGIAGNAIFDFSKRFGVGGGIEYGDNFKAARGFVRFNFGQRD